MDLLRGNIKTIYFKYLAAAFGSALISSIYSLVDMAVVGQYQGPAGTAALAVVAPIWNIIYSLGLLAGIGGSVLFSNLRGRADKNGADENEYFTVSMLLAVLFAVASWLRFFWIGLCCFCLARTKRCCLWHRRICSRLNLQCRCLYLTRCCRRF